MSKRERASDRERLLRLQKRIFHLLKAEADNLLGDTPEPIRRYERTFQRDFAQLSRGSVNQVSKESLIEAIRATDVTFISDFHAFRQSQRTAIRVLRRVVQPGERWLIGLEMISSKMQDALDDFQEGKISLEKFHQLIHYRETWGFQWENYAPIFNWAREHQIRLIALNKPREFVRIQREYAEERSWVRDISELHHRDRWAAGIITDLFAPVQNLAHTSSPARHARLKMIVLYGELHVATSHLPKQLTEVSKNFLKTPLQSLVLHQNHDGLYWNLARSNRDFHADIFRLKKNAYCIFSGTPWTKLQSLISWAEGAPDSNFSIENDDDGFVESDTDYVALMRNYSDTIAEFIAIPPPSYETMDVITIEDADLVESTLATSSLTRAEHATVKFLVRNNHRILIPGADVAYLGSPSHNSTAELATVRLFRRATRTDSIAMRTREDFFRLVLEAAFGFFGSLIINPRRKCSFPEDHRNRLKMIQDGNPELHPFEKESRLLALAFLENRRPWKSTSDSTQKQLCAHLRILEAFLAEKRLNPGILLAARFIGQSLGKRIHHAVIEGSVDTSLLRKIAAPYIRRNGGKDPLISFEDRYLEALRLTASSRNNPSSEGLL